MSLLGRTESDFVLNFYLILEMKQSTLALKFVLRVGTQDIISSFYLNFYMAFRQQKHSLKLCERKESMLMEHVFQLWSHLESLVNVSLTHINRTSF